MELKDLLPLLIIVGSAIFSIINRKKKRDAQEGEMPEKSMWETLLGEEEEPQPRMMREEEPLDQEDDDWWEKEESVVEVTEKEQVEQPVMTKETEPVVDDNLPKIKHPHESPIYNKSITSKKRAKIKPNFSNKNAVKQGIIFSEVFNRKKF